MTTTNQTDAPPRQAKGLKGAEAAERLRLAGFNLLPTRRRTPAWRQFAAQMAHFFVLMLWVTGALAIFAGCLDWDWGSSSSSPSMVFLHLYRSIGRSAPVGCCATFFHGARWSCETRSC